MAKERRSGGAAWRILVVDDVPVESWACVAALETVTDVRYDVKSETSPHAALEVAREWRPDLLILDIEMPGMDGYELAQSLKDDGCDASRLFLTKLGDDEDQVEALRLADDYIRKPFNALVFLQRVRNILSRRPQPNAATEQAPRDWRPQVDTVRRRVTMPDGRARQVTPNEMKALLALVRANGDVVSYADLIREVWAEEASAAGEAFDPAEFQDGLFATVFRLRQKVEPSPARPRYIHNVERVGYRYDPQYDGFDGPDEG